MKRNAFQLTMFVLMVLALAVSSCKDDDTTGNGTGGNGGNGGGGETMDADYMPRTAGNSWEYSDGSRVDMGNKEDEGGEDYWPVTNFGPISGISLDFAEDLTVKTIKIAKVEGDYNITATLDVLEIFGYEGLADPISYTILKDDVEAGTSWTGELLYVYRYTPTLPLLPEINTPPISVPYTFTVVETDMSLNVGGKTYENVIQVKQQFDNVIGGWVSTDIYYADGVGVIRYGTDSAITTPTDLVDYDVN